MLRILRFALAGAVALGLAWVALAVGMRGAIVIEEQVAARVGAAVAAARLDWLETRIDGLTVTLSGRAPDSFAQELARELVREAGGPVVLVDRSRVRGGPHGAGTARPASVAILRSGGRFTLTGTLAGAGARRGLAEALRVVAPGRPVEALAGLDAARPLDAEARAVGLLGAALIDEGQVVIGPGRAVSVGGVVGSEARLRAAAARLRPKAEAAGIALDLDLAVPPEVIAPFRFAGTRTATGTAVTRCAARDAGERARLDAALERAGAAGPAGGARCRSGLGGPAGDWPGAVEAALAILAESPEDTQLRLDYRTAWLIPPPGLAPGSAAALRDTLSARLPRGYAAALAPAPPAVETEAAAAPEPYWLHAMQAAGTVVLAGRMPGRAGVEAIETFAAAAFEARALRSSLTAAPAGTAPEGWQTSALAAVEALAALQRGEAALDPGRLRLTGTVTDPAEIGRLHRRLEAALPGRHVATRLTVDLPAQVAALPVGPARCAALLNALMQRRGVGFDPGSAVIDARGPFVLDRAAAILGRCPEARIEIGGHTDSQGSAGFNRRLGRARAEAVREALIARGIAGRRLEAEGYGEAEPVADNATEAGRARNRRIAFKPLETAS